MSTQNEARSTGRRAAEAAEIVDDMKERLSSRADELIAEGQEALEDMGSRVRGRVQEKPVTSLLIAAGVGVVIGMLLARRR